MTTVDSWTGEVGEDYGLSMTFDGTYIYIALDLAIGKVIKIDPSDMTTISIWTGASGENMFSDLNTDGKFIYIGSSSSPAEVIRKIFRNIDETGT